MKELSSEWPRNVPTTQFYSPSTSYRSSNQQSAFQHERLSEPVHVLLVESDSLSHSLCQEAFVQEDIRYSFVPDLPTARMLIHDADLAGTPYHLLIGELSDNDTQSNSLLAILSQDISMPAVIVIGSASADTILQALRLGVSDYLPQPVRSEHVRIAAERALARRRRQIREQQIFRRITDEIDQLYQLIQVHNNSYDDQINPFSSLLKIGPLSIDTDRHLIEWYGRPCAITPTEYALLRYLAETPGQIRSYGEIVRWTHTQTLSERDAKLLLKSHVRNLRRKFGSELLEHVKGTGYILHHLAHEGNHG